LQGSPDAVALVNRCLEVPEIRALFTPESGADEALRELPVEFMEKDTWWSGVIDRLVLRRDADGAVRKAVLIDFKTDQVDSVAVLRERYAGQLAIYRRAISTALELQEGQVEVLLLSTHLGTLPIPCGPAHPL
jgi:ATP-dependent exoDNAse (exonuclease V) beta subunit